MPRNSGPKEYDGIYGNQINKIMLDEAIDKLPSDQRNAVICRYIRRYSLGMALDLLKLTKKQYFAAHDMAISNIFSILNGRGLS